VNLSRGRVIKAGAGTVDPPTEPRRTSRRIPAVTAAAHAEASRIVDDAVRHATALEAAARSRVADVVRLASEEAREIEVAKLSAVALHLEARERRYTEGEAERAMTLARLLAERVVSAELTVAPERIADIALCPDDQAAATAAFARLGLAQGVVTFAVDPALTRGSVVVETDLGTIDGRLETRLPRLVQALTEALRNG
jgi:flagellar biosynthesis/type III secretory pathway protein FliH